MEIFVGNMPSSMNRDQLKALFQLYGMVSAGRVIVDKFSGLSRGFGFVVMPNENEAMAAIEVVNGQAFQGSVLRAEISRTPPRVELIHGESL